MPLSPRAVCLLSCLWLTAACDAPRVVPDTQGVSVQPGPCGRGLLVMETDYQSSNVSLIDFEGHVLSASLASSSTESSGFGVTLSSDATPPSSPQNGTRVVLIDRYPAGVLRFVELSNARLKAELSVGTGFKSNPQDYLALTEHQAYVSRYQANAHPGAQAFDAGGDILVVDPSVPEITSRIDLSPAMAGEPARFSAHPSQLALVNGRVFAILAAYANDSFTDSGTARLVELDPASNGILSTLLLDRLHGCASFAVAPDGHELAVACPGDDWTGDPPEQTGSGVALVDISGTPRLRQRFDASEFGPNVVSFNLSYVAQNQLLFGTFGYRDQATTAVASLDTLVQLDTDSRTWHEVLRAERDPFTLGGVRCETRCGACFAADAQRAGGSVLRFPITGAGELAEPTPIRAERRVGLPPRYLGVF